MVTITGNGMGKYDFSNLDLDLSNQIMYRFTIHYHR